MDRLLYDRIEVGGQRDLGADPRMLADDHRLLDRQRVVRVPNLRREAHHPHVMNEPRQPQVLSRLGTQPEPVSDLSGKLGHAYRMPGVVRTLVGHEVLQHPQRAFELLLRVPQ